MKLNCHFYLGVCLLRRHILSVSRENRIPFLLGCVEPDLNVFTYLKGSLHGQRFCGHNFPNILPRMQTLLFQLEHSKAESPVYFYRLGKLTHYLADAFTWPHNSTFSGTLRDHVRYEKDLASCFMDSAHGKIQLIEIQWACHSPLSILLEKHNEYLLAPVCIHTDVHYITGTASLVLGAFRQPSDRKLSLLPAGGAV